jgi:hypothetical protein
MATRTIVTSQPDVACDVCARRLLRGEQHDIFIAAGRRRTVCELCAPRAAHEGWTRESDSASVGLAPMRPRRGRSFFDRLRQATRPGDAPVDGSPDDAAAQAQEGEFLGGYGAGEQSAPAPFDVNGEEPAAAPAVPAVPADPADLLREHALEVFNTSEYPRRVAGVARSLGAPEVNVTCAEHLESVVRVVVAWELCWYRYEVDLSEPTPEAQVMAQGTELSELAREERIVNARADERGLLALAW